MSDPFKGYFYPPPLHIHFSLPPAWPAALIIPLHPEDMTHVLLST